MYAAADAEIATRLPSHVPVVHVFNKVDDPGAACACFGGGPGMGGVVGPNRAGAGGFAPDFVATGGLAGSAGGVFIARQRHVQSLRQAREHVEAAQAHAALADGALDLMAEELRLAHNALGTITGAFSSDDLLGEIFTRFCIGK